MKRILLLALMTFSSLSKILVMDVEDLRKLILFQDEDATEQTLGECVTKDGLNVWGTLNADNSVQYVFKKQNLTCENGNGLPNYTRTVPNDYKVWKEHPCPEVAKTNTVISSKTGKPLLLTHYPVEIRGKSVTYKTQAILTSSWKKRRNFITYFDGNDSLKGRISAWICPGN